MSLCFSSWSFHVQQTFVECIRRCNDILQGRYLRSGSWLLRQLTVYAKSLERDAETESQSCSPSIGRSKENLRTLVPSTLSPIPLTAFASRFARPGSITEMTLTNVVEQTVKGLVYFDLFLEAEGSEKTLFRLVEFASWVGHLNQFRKSGRSASDQLQGAIRTHWKNRVRDLVKCGLVFKRESVIPRGVIWLTVNRQGGAKRLQLSAHP
jgi:hypothetical protein